MFRGGEEVVLGIAVLCEGSRERKRKGEQGDRREGGERERKKGQNLVDVQHDASKRVRYASRYLQQPKHQSATGRTPLVSRLYPLSAKKDGERRNVQRIWLGLPCGVTMSVGR